MRLSKGLIILVFVACEGTLDQHQDGIEEYGYLPAEEVRLREAPVVKAVPPVLGERDFEWQVQGDGVNGTLPPRRVDPQEAPGAAVPPPPMAIDLGITDEQRQLIETTTLHSSARGGGQ